MFLVHSYLYYQMDESIIDDTEYDMICDRLKSTEGSDYYACDLIEKHFSQEEASGYSIKRKDYPPEIVSTAMHLLYQSKYVKQNISFEKFLSMHGYKIADIVSAA